MDREHVIVNVFVRIDGKGAMAALGSRRCYASPHALGAASAPSKRLRIAPEPMFTCLAESACFSANTQCL